MSEQLNKNIAVNEKNEANIRFVFLRLFNILVSAKIRP